MTRRKFLQNSTMGSMLAFFAVSNLNAAVLGSRKSLLGFEEIGASSADEVIVPKGYESKILLSWGDPLFSKAYKYDESKKIDERAVENAKLCFGDNTDGMSFFELDSKRAILAVNNEYINPELMFTHQGKKLSKNDVLYEQANVGVSIFEIEKEGEFYSVVLDSKFNRNGRL